MRSKSLLEPVRDLKAKYCLDRKFLKRGDMKMMWWAKILLTCGVFGILIFTGNKLFTQQKVNTLTIQEVSLGLQYQSLGMLRDEGKATIDMEETVDELIVQVCNVQKNHGKDIRISYVFLDENANVTEVEEEVESIQFKVELLDGNGEVVSSAERRLALKVG